MKTLIVARHGDYLSDSGGLSDYGRSQIGKLGEALQSVVDGAVLILNSTAPRAVESAAILTELFTAPSEGHKFLWSGSDAGFDDNPAARKLVEGHAEKFDTIIMVTHFEYVESFPAYWCEHALGVKLRSHEIEKGEAWVIDCEGKRIMHLSPMDRESGSWVEGTPAPKPASALPEKAAAQHLIKPQGRVTRDDAETYAQALKDAAKASKKLKGVYLFGSVAKIGAGHDMDFVFEVPKKVFLKYASQCVGALDGFHPVKKALLPMASMYWDYFSPEDARVRYAHGVVGISEETLGQLGQHLPGSSLDVICLPVGWRDGKSDVSKMLNEAFGFGPDPDLLKHIAESAIAL